MASGSSSWESYFLQMLNLGMGQISFKAKSNKHCHKHTGQIAEVLQRSGVLPRDPWDFVIILYGNLRVLWIATAIEWSVWPSQVAASQSW